MRKNNTTLPRVLSWVLLIVVLGVLGVAQRALALSVDNTGGSLGLTSRDLIDTVVTVINWVLSLLGLIAVSYVIYGGYVWLTSHGNDEQVAKAKKIILNATIGVIVVLLSWAIVSAILNADNTNGTPGDGGDGSSCTTGETSSCSDCVEGHWVYNAGRCPFANEPFEIRAITTSCGSPQSSYQDDVYLCSAVSILFNQVVTMDNLQHIIESPATGETALKVEECGDVNCTTVSQPTPLFAASAPTIAYSGGTPTGQKAEFVANGKSISFVHAHQLYKPSTTYKLTIPLTVANASGKALTSTGCKQTDGTPVPGCTFNAQGQAFEWIYHVGTQTDTTPPTALSSYPVFSGTTYPDRNVSRAPVITMQFDEAIAPWTITPGNIQIRPVTGAGEDGTGGSVGDPVTGYDTQPVADGFELSFIDGHQLDAFTWYEMSVSGIQDLCLNAATPKTWRFQTNGVGVGIAQVYPSDNYAYACPDTEIFVQFNTTMYDPRTSSCNVHATDGGYVTGGAQILPREFTVEDAKPPTGNPNDYCKKYSWLPSTDQIDPDVAYHPSVQTRLTIDSNGNKLSKAWSFSTKKPSECANAPYVSSVSPPTGQAGRCLSVIGNNFRATKGTNDVLSFQKKDASWVQADAKNWSNTAIVTNAPDLNESPLPYSAPVQVSVDYGNPIGVLTSTANNAATFTYNQTGAYTGPCLYSLSPDSGYRGDRFAFHGERFMVTASKQIVHIDGMQACVGDATNKCWATDTDGSVSVPMTAPYGNDNVSIENNTGRSNEIPYTVNKVPPGAFQVNSYIPSCNGDVVCTNATIAATLSQSVLGTSVTPANAELRTCIDQSCGTLNPNAPATTVAYDDSIHRIVITPTGGTVPGTWYRMILHGGTDGIQSTDGKLLGNLNYSGAGTTTNDAYSWTFGVKDTATACSANALQCQPATASIAEGGTRQLSGHAYSAPNECDAGGSELDGTRYAWTWASNDPSYVTVAPATTGIGTQPVTTASGKAATPVGLSVAVTTTADSKSAQCLLTVSNLSCETDADCVNNPQYANVGQCGGSTCAADTHLCTPVVKSISPEKGAPGSWMTIRGCYFGSYVDGASKVLYAEGGTEKTGQWPPTAQCGAPGATWSDSQIVVVAPPDLDVTKKSTVRVRRSDTQTADAAKQFDASGALGPGLCSVAPSSGKAGSTTVALKGANLGNGTGANDVVTFFRSINIPASSTTWASDGQSITDISVPASAQNKTESDYNEIVVTTAAGTSNGLNFDLTSASCVACTDTDSSACTAKQACGTVGGNRCCADKPIVIANAPKNPPFTCVNASVTASFVDASGQPLPMDTATISAATVTLTRADDVTKSVALTNFTFPTSSSFIATPTELLDKNTAYRVTLKGSISTGTKITLGDDFTWNFTTKADADPCPVASVSIMPDSMLFTDFGIVQTMTANAYDATGQLIHSVLGYSWTWDWVSGDISIVTAAAATGDQGDITSNAAKKNGETDVTATANISDGKKQAGSSHVAVNACKDPWQWKANVGIPYTPYTDDGMHFSTWYCKDETKPIDLQLMTGPGTGDLLWQLFAENPTVNQDTHVKDAVGLQVFSDNDHLSPADWYKKKFGKTGGSATSQVDGYEALRDGNTYYIAGTNLDSESGRLYTNMYMLAYNIGAASDIANIFNQMVANFRLNTNRTDFATPDDASMALQKVRRDTKRMADLASLASSLASYDITTGTFPRLPSGSYITDASTSKWPSWTQTLTSTLQQKVAGVVVPNDPVNDFTPACAAPFNADTCWDEIGKTFSCPADSHIYAYTAGTDGKSYALFNHMEYAGMGSWQVGSAIDCGTLGSCACFTYKSSAQSSGNALINDTTAPSTPTSLTASDVTSESVKLTWGASNDFGGSGIQWYDVWRSVDGANYVTVARVSGQPLSYTDTGLGSDTTYYYKVSAHDNAGNDSFRSDPAIAKTLF